MTKPNCWQFKGCERGPGGARVDDLGVCPAAIDETYDGANEGHNAGRICWLVAGTYCEGQRQGSFAQKIASCASCDFFQLTRDEEGSSFELTPQWRYSELFESLSEAALVVDRVTGAVVLANQEASRLTGLARSVISGSKLTELFAGQDVAVSLESFSALGGRAMLELGRAQLTTREGFKPVRLRLEPLAESGSCMLLAQFRDISEELQAKEQLELMQFSLDHAADAVFWFGPTGRFVYINEQACRALGYTRTELLSMSVPDIELEFPVERWPAHWQELQREKSMFFESVHKRKDGTTLPVDISVTFLNYGGREYGFGSARDISDRVSLDRQLQQAQKMEAVGLLAGGVAHDFNNMLSVILSYGSIVMSELDEADPLREDVAEICEAGKRAARLTQQLLTFSRKNVVVPTMVDVDEVLTGMGKMIGRLVGEHIEVETKLNAAGAVVLVDRGQLEQVVMNLVVNARDATVKGGRMTLETHVRGEDTAGEDSTSKHATIVVRDNGAGMDAQTMERVFEPFFTTKRRGSGTGLGLSTAYGIISKAGGRLHVSSRLGEGSVFTIELPISEHAQTRETISEAPDEHGPVSGATVLLVEDEREVRKLARRILERAGYRVLDADNAGTALLLLEEHPSPIDLLLTDVVMPHVSGPALAKRLKEQQPNIQVLFMTGYADDSYLKNEEMVSGHSLLLKPITPAKLIEKVREALVEDSG